MKLDTLPLHHALLVTTASREGLHTELFNDALTKTLASKLFAHTVFDIDTAREIITWANTPYQGQKIGIISFHTASVPAQNAILKMLEEPQVNVRFILVTSNKDKLLTTVLSRLQHVLHDEETITNSFGEIFLATAPTKRMELPAVKKLLDKVDEEERKDRESVRASILSLLPVLTKSSRHDASHIQKVLECASYAGDSSSSGKALLEYLALLLPQTKA